MKKTLLLTVLLLGAISFNSYSQCNTSLAGNFVQRDSCTSYTFAQYSNVVITTYSTDELRIADFGSITPPHSARIVVDCINLTLDVPNQFAGSTTLWGSGTFTANFNQLNIIWTIDFGSFTLTCSETYTRQGTAVEELPVMATLSLYPNPTSSQLNFSFPETGNYFLAIKNTLGETIFTSAETEKTFSVDVNAFPAGIYFVTVMDEKKNMVTKKFVKM